MRLDLNTGLNFSARRLGCCAVQRGDRVHYCYMTRLDKRGRDVLRLAALRDEVGECRTFKGDGIDAAFVQWRLENLEEDDVVLVARDGAKKFLGLATITPMGGYHLLSTLFAREKRVRGEKKTKQVGQALMAYAGALVVGDNKTMQVKARKNAFGFFKRWFGDDLPNETFSVDPARQARSINAWLKQQPVSTPKLKLFRVARAAHKAKATN